MQEITTIATTIINNALHKLKQATKKIALGILCTWLIWLIAIIVLIIAVGGFISGIITVISFIAMLLYSAISAPAKIKLAAVKLAAEIPMDLAIAIINNLGGNFPPEAANELKNKIANAVQNPVALLYNPKKAADLASEISGIVSNATAINQ